MSGATNLVTKIWDHVLCVLEQSDGKIATTLTTWNFDDGLKSGFWNHLLMLNIQ